MASEVDNVALFYLHQPLCDAVKGAYHLKCLFVAEDLHLRIELAEDADRSGMVGLHVVDDEVVDGTPLRHDRDEPLHIGGELVGLDRVDDRALFVVDEIGVVSHASGKFPKPLEEVGLAVVAAYPIYRIRYLDCLLHHFYGYLLNDIAYASHII